MPARTSFVATFHGATRRNTSRNGNPTWILSTSEGTYLTQTDGSIGYAIGNYTGGPDNLLNREVTFYLDGSRVWDMRPTH